MKKLFDRITEAQIGLAMKVMGYVAVAIAIGIIIAGIIYGG